MPSPYANSAVITDMSLNWASHIELAPGSDNFPITWAANGHQYTAWGDGGGFGGTDQNGRVSLGVGRVEGDKGSFTGHNVWGGLNPENAAQFEGKSYGILALNGVLYMLRYPGSDTTCYSECKIASSSNSGASWTLESWTLCTQAQGVVMPTFCQFGQAYASARDGYVYVYGTNLKGSSSLQIQDPGEIVLARCPVDELLTQGSWEWLSNLTGPTWSTNIANRVPIFEDPDGVGWCLSVSYNIPLQRYLLMTEHLTSFQGRMGVFDAQEPWGPWTTVIYSDNLGTGNVPGMFFGNFANKWLSQDGKSFVLVLTGTGGGDSWNSVEGTFTAVSPANPGFGRSGAAMSVKVGTGMSASEEHRIPRGR